MRYFKYCLYIFVCAVTISACSDYLNYDEMEKYNGAVVKNDRYRLRDMIAGGYGDITADLNPVGSAQRASASDDAEEALESASVQKMNDGRWSAINTVDARWSAFYTGIRKMNNFLKIYTGHNLKAKKYNDNYAELKELFSHFPYEARFLRAFFYFRLIKRYGHVPLIRKTLTPKEANNVKPSTYQEITDFIVSECTAIAPHLPIDYHNEPFNYTGKATRGAALALKAKALLYAASPLHNPSNNIRKWKKAAKAAWQIIEKHWYSLDPSYSHIFKSINSPGLIFTVRYATSNYMERQNFPAGYQGTTKDGTQPTQNLVSAYRMQKTGLSIHNPNSGYDPSHPYKGRDPRLYATVIVNNSMWKGRKVEIWRGGLDGPPVIGATETGYYLKKGINEDISLSTTHTTQAHHFKVIFRYGGILLDYAEAMNEAYGPYDPAGFGMTAREAVNKIRGRKSVNMPKVPMGLSKAEFRKQIHHERRVEMAFENQRFWDIRRWKIGPQTQQDIKGMKITKTANGFNYKVVTIEHRVWNDKMYYYPIPQNELFINSNLKQNDGW